jgi:hypothetical protein
MSVDLGEDFESQTGTSFNIGPGLAFFVSESVAIEGLLVYRNETMNQEKTSMEMKLRLFLHALSFLLVSRHTWEEIRVVFLIMKKRTRRSSGPFFCYLESCSLKEKK